MDYRPVILLGLLLAISAVLPASADPALATPSIIAKLRSEAEKLRLPPDIAEAVGFVETGFDPTKIGTAGEVGVMQVMPQTAAMLGFRGTDDQLADVDTNARYGVNYLAEAWRLADHDLCRALTKYRAGHGAEIMTEKSVTYCRRARAYLASIHSPLSDGVAIPAIASSSHDETSALSLASDTGRSTGFWARERARVRALDAKVRARWALIAAHNARALGGRGKAREL